MAAAFATLRCIRSAIYSIHHDKGKSMKLCTSPWLAPTPPTRVYGNNTWGSLEVRTGSDRNGHPGHITSHSSSHDHLFDSEASKTKSWLLECDVLWPVSSCAPLLQGFICSSLSVSPGH